MYNPNPYDNSIYQVYKTFYNGKGPKSTRTLVLVTTDYDEAIAKANEIRDEKDSFFRGEIVERYLVWTSRTIYRT